MAGSSGGNQVQLFDFLVSWFVKWDADIVGLFCVVLWRVWNVAWRPSSYGRYKVNTDVAIDKASKTVGIGIVIQAKAIFRGISLAQDIGIFEVEADIPKETSLQTVCNTFQLKQTILKSFEKDKSHQPKTMASSSKLLLFFLSPIFIHFLALGTIAQLNMTYHDCYLNFSKNTTGSSYEKNLIQLLDSLGTNTGIDYGFYNFSYRENFPDKVYAVGICRPDMDAESCRDCISEASKNITSICPHSSLAIAGFDDGEYRNCMLRYANYDIFGLMEDAPVFFRDSQRDIMENLVEFSQKRNKLLERLIGEAAARGSPTKYAVGEEGVSKNLSLYALVQCNPDLSEANCTSCLYSILGNISDCCDTKDGGGVDSPSCRFRYEKTKFYNASIEGTPPPNPKGKKNIVIIVVCSVVGSVILIIFIGCIILRMRKTEEDDENKGDLQNRVLTIQL
ncbi:hypothetical protein EZV62_026468 [Acer yangbiense]|uniref:Gnk2-homologous domain-containing protein n=1 Tax=Acer yangbiense TaxID=1000413 RepID=A0A5C7GQV0_9ROSI|nr:hypothetical protein EZV62_026468 [Acer yangbiense]